MIMSALQASIFSVGTLTPTWRSGLFHSGASRLQFFLPKGRAVLVEPANGTSALTFLLRPLVRFQDSLAQADRLGCHFHQFVIGNKLQSLFERKIFHRHQPHRFV